MIELGRVSEETKGIPGGENEQGKPETHFD